MPSLVELRVVSGPSEGSIYRFDEHDVLLIGRDDDCHARLPADDKTASRHHAVIEIAPPIVRLRDLESLNGTFVNGRRHGGPPGHRVADSGIPAASAPIQLANSDEIRIGQTTFRLSIHADTVPLTDDMTTPCDSARDAGPEPAAIEETHGYDVVRKLSEGGMGSVHLVRRRSDDALFARKTMLARVAVSAHARHLFEREIEITRTLRHPNVVRLVEYSAANGAFFFVMELCEGGSLADLLAERRTLPLDEAAPIMLSALEGLAYAHAIGVVHRDLKPGNVLLSSRGSGVAKIADMGLAKSFDRAGLSGITVTGGFAGTLDYMPREQLVSYKYVKPATDVWSIAATFYMTLTGELPRERGRSADPLVAVLDATAVPVRERNPDIPAPVAAVIDRALASDAADRYTTAQAFRDALQAAL
jgi:eukaryotic-like serine/threonine-protein kinase